MLSKFISKLCIFYNDRKFSNWIALASLILAIVSMLVSIRGCAVAQDAFQLGQKQYREERLLVLQGAFSDDHSYVTLSSISEGATFLDGWAVFPKEIAESKFIIRSAEKKIDLVFPSFAMRKMVAQRRPTIPGILSAYPDTKLPILIEANYTSRGERYQDRSIYLLGIDWVFPDGPYDAPGIKFTGFTFLKRLEDGKPFDGNALEEMFDSKSGFYFLRE